jgi:hypothetical protein
MSTPALPPADDEDLMQQWDNADPEEHLPTIPGTAILDTVQGNTFLWDKTCNKGLKYDGELMSREDYEMSHQRS